MDTLNRSTENPETPHGWGYRKEMWEGKRCKGDQYWEAQRSSDEKHRETQNQREHRGDKGMWEEEQGHGVPREIGRYRGCRGAPRCTRLPGGVGV